MLKRLLVVGLLLIAGDSSGQTSRMVPGHQQRVEVPDYNDVSMWEFIRCDDQFLQPTDENWYLWHEDYRLKYPASKGEFVTVMYKPLETRSFRFKNDLIVKSRTEPWLALYYDVQGDIGSVSLFEYKGDNWNKGWQLVSSFDSNEKAIAYVKEGYRLK